ncbi:NPCBM/NEW2 domain-containing protein [Paenibacillus sp. Marseille-Q4541]|uniref:NPCBM/NEW2 domain-containing protein n=1 Tax=Paenibacillus sp. Marseille-Q4541 TaxID=2831522 RepID=UPI001BA73323|nr:NPCBM/NEW2 domain-containing protein [Paenibacillus sp. Marseille-Q4541]
MSLTKKLKYGVTGFTLGAVFFGGIAFGATTKIEVSLDPIKFIVDGKDKTPLNGKFNNNGTVVPASLSYSGTTYVPLKMVGDMVSKEVAWDGKTKSVLIGDPGSVGEQKSLTDLPPLKISSGNVDTNRSLKINDERYTKGIMTSVHSYNRMESQSYNLNGQYETLNFGYGTISVWSSGNLVKISVYGDGKELWSGNAVNGVPVNTASVPVKGVQELEIRFEAPEGDSANTTAAVVNPVLIK